MRILGICGSLQTESSNLTLLRRAQALLPTPHTLEIFDGIGALPHFNPDLEGGPVPAAVRAWRAAIASSDALFIASPEYGHSLPGALKNAVDWVIGSGELETKLIAVTASTPGPGRGQRGLDALLQTLGAVRARVVGGEPIVRGDDSDALLGVLLDALIERSARGDGRGVDD